MLFARTTYGHLSGCRGVVLALLALIVNPASSWAVPPVPLDVQCLGIRPDRPRVRFSGAGDTLYEIWQRKNNEDWSRLNCGDLFGPLSENSDGEYIGEYKLDIDENETGEEWRYTVRAVGENDEEDKSDFSVWVLNPDWITSGDFRVFYSTSECPPMHDGGSNCFNDNSAAQFIADVANGTLDRFDQLLFNPVSFASAIRRRLSHQYERLQRRRLCARLGHRPLAGPLWRLRSQYEHR